MHFSRLACTEKQTYSLYLKQHQNTGNCTQCIKWYNNFCWKYTPQSHCETNYTALVTAVNLNLKPVTEQFTMVSVSYHT